MNVQAVSAVVFLSKQPERLAGFYRKHLGIAFEPERHGGLEEHFEATMGGMHLAVVPGNGREAAGGSGVSPTFRVQGLQGWIDELSGAGVRAVGGVLELGEKRRLVSFRDPDGNLFSLIDLGL
jgi:predicted enzyme related to lactoylglutathione lyase